MEMGKREITYLSLYTVTTRMTSNSGSRVCVCVGGLYRRKQSASRGNDFCVKTGMHEAT